MELKQSDLDDNELLSSDGIKKNTESKSTRLKNRIRRFRDGEDPKSLLSSWEATLADKKNHSSDNQADTAGEIRLHTSTDETVNTTDPPWEPWKGYAEETKSANPSEPSPNQSETEPIVERPLTTVDPALAAEAQMHAQAVASIAEQHAQDAIMPDYKDNLPKEAQDIMDRLQPAPEHHLEQSAWHNIEVDNKTGKVVDKPTFDYGEAFRSEQRAETAPLHADPSSIATASGQLAVSSPLLSDAISKDHTLNSGQPGANNYASSYDQFDGMAHRRVNYDPLLWLILIVVIFAIILALVI